MSDDKTEALLAERGKTHGNYSKQAEIGVILREAFFDSPNAKKDRLNYVEQDALLMISVKLSRILTGNPHVKDHWDDIAGYAKLVSKTLSEVESKQLDRTIGGQVTLEHDPSAERPTRT